tara:strand:+ start:3942 stop:5153 length:1212 start_codon:yes stop_codon:yes gene_type:complete
MLKKIKSPPIIYIKGEEMSRYTMNLFIEKCIKPHINIDKWKYYDLSCKNRDNTNDKVLYDSIDDGKNILSIFKEPTITPSEIQRKELKLKNTLMSPNGLMREKWNGFTISRDTIHIDGVKLGYKNPVFFERHAIGGEYSAGWKKVKQGKVKTIYYSDEESFCIDERELKDDINVVVTYHNPLDNVQLLAHTFFQRCLKNNIIPYVVTKKTVFKWQEEFWIIIKNIFDEHYKESFINKNLLENTNQELGHLISDAATMKIIKWTDGNFGMIAHNYDADMLTDEIAQVHKSPGFITSNLTGKREDGYLIRQFEASHGTGADLWYEHLEGKETSFNPLGMIEALIGSLNYSNELYKTDNDIVEFNNNLRNIIHQAYRCNMGTRDICGDKGLTTEEFINYISYELKK